MLAFVPLLTLATAALPRALAHGGVLSYSNAGSWYWGWAPYNSPTGQTTIQRPWSSYNPITDATDPTLACNDDGTSGALQLTATVAAGSPVTAYWNQVWPHAYGPMLTYLAECPGTTCTGVDASTLSWVSFSSTTPLLANSAPRSFPVQDRYVLISHHVLAALHDDGLITRVDEAGLLSGTIAEGSWGDGQMIDQNSSWTTTIPSSVPSGNYLIRFETIALHSLPAQFYPECAQIEITGGGTLAPTAAELVTFPGGYSNTDPGLTVDLYDQAATTETTYVIPGPPLYAGAAGSTPAPAPAPSSSATAAPAPTTSAAAPAPTSSAPSGGAGSVPEYGQCGGTGYTGATAWCALFPHSFLFLRLLMGLGLCSAAPYTCQYSNDYYSQCL
ncbi:glycosyl hydrolase family 61-domain-containing protein [Amylostereum chailletii]|nr:glycosyl hydrolase family 61-domain-containing protein [Amylostereum chailletii]